MPDGDQNPINDFRKIFNAFPEVVKDYFYSDESNNVIVGLVKKFHLSEDQRDALNGIVGDLFIKDLDFGGLLAAAESEMGLSKDKSKDLSLELLGNYFLPLNDFYGGEVEKTIKVLGGKIKDYPELRVMIKKESAGSAADEVAKEFLPLFSDEILRHRFIELLDSRLREVRKESDLREILMRNSKVGGLGLEEEIAQKIIDAAAEKMRSVKIVADTTVDNASRGEVSSPKKEVVPPEEVRPPQVEIKKESIASSVKFKEVPPRSVIGEKPLETPPKPPPVVNSELVKLVPPPVVKPEPLKPLPVVKVEPVKPPPPPISKSTPPPVMKSEPPKLSSSVIPAQAGIQKKELDPGSRSGMTKVVEPIKPPPPPISKSTPPPIEKKSPSPPVGEGWGEGKKAVPPSPLSSPIKGEEGKVSALSASNPRNRKPEISDAELEREIQHIRHDKMPEPEAPSLDFAAVAARIAAESRINLGNEQLGRLKIILTARLKDIRDSAETKEILSRDYVLGGMGFSDGQIRALSPILEGEFKKIEERQKSAAEENIATTRRGDEERRKKLADEAKSAEQNKLDSRFSEITGKKSKRPVKEVSPPGEVKPPQVKQEIPLSPSIPRPLGTEVSKGEVADRPRLQDVRYESKLVGPIDEIKRLTLTDFRRLGASAKAAVAKIKEKVEALKSDSIKKWQEGIAAWSNGEVNKLYLQIFAEALRKKKSLKEISAERAAAGTSTLSQDEINAIMELNKSLRF